MSSREQMDVATPERAADETIEDAVAGLGSEFMPYLDDVVAAVDQDISPDDFLKNVAKLDQSEHVTQGLTGLAKRLMVRPEKTVTMSITNGCAIRPVRSQMSRARSLMNLSRPSVLEDEKSCAGESDDESTNSPRKGTAKSKSKSVTFDEQPALPKRDHSQPAAESKPESKVVSIAEHPAQPKNVEQSVRPETIISRHSMKRRLSRPETIRLDKGYKIRLPRSGQVLFHVDAFIAQGNFGEVYKVSAPGSAHKYAMKRVRYAKFLRNDDFDRQERKHTELMHCREARLLLELKEPHPNVITVHFCIITTGEFLMFQALVAEARSLDHDLGSLYCGSVIDVRNRLRQILIGVAKALAFVHDNGILHQDVKNGNVLLDSKENPVLVDFGLACHGEGKGADLRAQFKGYTRGFHSPEVAHLSSRESGGEYSSESSLLSPATHDIWAWAATAVALFCRTSSGREPDDQCCQIEKFEPIDASWSNAEMAQWTERMVSKFSQISSKSANILRTEFSRLGGAAEALSLQPNQLPPSFKKVPMGSKKVLQIALNAPTVPLRLLLVRCFDRNPTARPQSFHEVLDELGSEAEVVVPVEKTRRRSRSIITQWRDGDSVDISSREIALHNLGCAFDDLGQTDEAVATLQAAHDSSDAATVLGEIHIRLDAHELAVTAFQRAIDLDKRNARAHWGLGLAFEHQGMVELAAEEWEKSLQMEKSKKITQQLSPIPQFGANLDAATVHYLEAYVERQDNCLDAITGDIVQISECRTDTKLVRLCSRAGGVSDRPGRTAMAACAKDCAQDPILAQTVCDVFGPAYKGISRLCIQGRGGSGKTWLLRHFGVTLADRQLKATVSESSAIFPIRVSLLDLAAHLDEKDPLESLRESWQETHCDLLARAHKAERVLLLLDGLDEVPAAKHDDLLEWLGSVTASFVVVTTRPHVINLDLEEKGFEVCQLLPPTDPKELLGDIEIPAMVRRHALIRSPHSILILRLADGR